MCDRETMYEPTPCDCGAAKVSVFWNRKKEGPTYEVALGDMSHLQVSQQILLTLERIEVLVASIESQTKPPTEEEIDEIAELTAEAIDKNTELLSKISLSGRAPKGA